MSDQIRRIGSFRSGQGGAALIIETGSGSARIERSELATFNTEGRLRGRVQQLLGHALPRDLFFHFNRDGSLAAATGAAPEVWPEDHTPDEDRDEVR